MSEFTEHPDVVIRGMACRFHSYYRAVPMYRAYDLRTGRPRMKYYALTDAYVLESDNLAGIKMTVGQHLNTVRLTCGEAYIRDLIYDGRLLQFNTEAVQ